MVHLTQYRYPGLDIIFLINIWMVSKLGFKILKFNDHWPLIFFVIEKINVVITSFFNGSRHKSINLATTSLCGFGFWSSLCGFGFWTMSSTISNIFTRSFETFDKVSFNTFWSIRDKYTVICLSNDTWCATRISSFCVILWGQKLIIFRLTLYERTFWFVQIIMFAIH